MEEPRRPQNAYWMFVSGNREAIQKEAGTKSVGAVGKLAGEKWKKMTAEEKQPYEKKAEMAKAAYDKAMDEYKAQGGVAGKRRQEKKDAQAAKSSKKARRTKDPNKPKKPQTAYWLWLSENRPALIKEVGTNVAKVGKLGGEKWGALSDKDKEPYQKKAAELKEEYSKALEEYKKTAGATAEDDGDDDDEDDEEVEGN